MSEFSRETTELFRHVTADKSSFYRAIMDVFAAANRQFRLHLLPDEVRAEAHWPNGEIPSLEAVQQALSQLADWGNLLAQPDTSRVSSVEDFYRARYLYRLSAKGEAVESGLAAFVQALARRAELQTVALEDILNRLEGLTRLAAETPVDPAKIHEALRDVVTVFTGLAENAQAFMAGLARSIEIESLRTDLAVQREDRLRALEQLDHRQETLDREAAAAPNDDALRRADAQYSSAEQQRREAQDRLAQVEARLQQAEAALWRVQKELADDAQDLRLPRDPLELAEIERALSEYSDASNELLSTARDLFNAQRNHFEQCAREQQARTDIAAHSQSLRERQRVEQDSTARRDALNLESEVAANLQRLVQDAERRVGGINAELKRHPTSTGVYFKLEWQPLPEGDEGAPVGLAAARVRLLRQVAEAWSPQDRRLVGEFLQQRIQTERDRDEQGALVDHLVRALDYRLWHRFRVKRYQAGEWRSLSGPASSGERALGLTVPLFAAASSHYASGEWAYAPRLVLMDEAFVGIDDTARAHCMALIREFDLDFVMTSERE